MEQEALLAVIVILVILLVVFVLASGREDPPKDIYRSIPELREIIARYPDSKLGEEAEIFLIKWQGMQKKIKRMGGEERKKLLSDIYYTRVQPMLEAHKRFQQQTRRNKK
ncbi:MAG TPA: hypothetical protein VI794_03135 [Patescibacteria group bacterium]|nr:hypothetical protein [Patescibacteria group bacterium]